MNSPASVLMPLLLGASLVGGCRGPVDSRDQSVHSDGGYTTSVPVGAVPMLKTNEVLRIALDALAAKSINTQTYRCDGIVFDPGATSSQTASGQWIVCFRRQPRSPDMEFFVAVNDKTRKARIYR